MGLWRIVSWELIYMWYLLMSCMWNTCELLNHHRCEIGDTNTNLINTNPKLLVSRGPHRGLCTSPLVSAFVLERAKSRNRGRYLGFPITALLGFPQCMFQRCHVPMGCIWTEWPQGCGKHRSRLLEPGCRFLCRQQGDSSSFPGAFLLQVLQLANYT